MIFCPVKGVCSFQQGSLKAFQFDTLLGGGHICTMSVFLLLVGPIYWVSRPRSSWSSWGEGVMFGTDITDGFEFSLLFFQSIQSDCTCHMLVVARLAVLLCAGCCQCYNLLYSGIVLMINFLNMIYNGQ